MRFARSLPTIEPVDAAAVREARRRHDTLTKPPGSLGRIEDLAAWYAGVSGDPRPTPPSCHVFVVAADHGVAMHGVSAYPREVTSQMLANFVRGGAAVSVLARHLGAGLTVVDAGVLTPIAGVIDRRIAAGTADFTCGPAMPVEEARRAITNGLDLVAALPPGTVVIPGEMGIGNTTSAAALATVLCGVPAASVTGRGTGLDDARLATKLAAVEAGIAANRLRLAEPLGVLAALGGFEIATLAGVIIGAAANRCAIVLDGFISTVAALVATGLAPGVRDYLLASHRSAEPGHGIVLERLSLEPLFDLGLRLGEASGALLALPLLRAACALLSEMASFDEAGVSGSEP